MTYSVHVVSEGLLSIHFHSLFSVSISLIYYFIYYILYHKSLLSRVVKQQMNHHIALGKRTLRFVC